MRKYKITAYKYDVIEPTEVRTTDSLKEANGYYNEFNLNPNMYHAIQITKHKWKECAGGIFIELKMKTIKYKI